MITFSKKVLEGLLVILEKFNMTNCAIEIEETGIGQVLKIQIPITLYGVGGTFTIDLSHIEDW